MILTRGIAARLLPAVGIVLVVSVALATTGHPTALRLVTMTLVIVGVGLGADRFAASRGHSRRRRWLQRHGHAGWTIRYAMTGADQKGALRGMGLRAVANRPATLAYGPTGVELWTGPGNGRRVFAFGWSEIDDVDEGVVANPRGVTFAGLRIVPADATPQSVLVAVPRSLRAAHPARTWAGSVALDMREVRGRAPERQQAGP